MAAQGKVTTNSTWLWEEPSTSSTDDDFHGMRSLDLLAERFEPHAEALWLLGERYSVKVLMIGFSNSTRGGFSVEPNTMIRLGLLGAAFVPTIHVTDPEKTSSNRPSCPVRPDPTRQVRQFAPRDRRKLL